MILPKFGYIMVRSIFLVALASWLLKSCALIVEMTEMRSLDWSSVHTYGIYGDIVLRLPNRRREIGGFL